MKKTLDYGELILVIKQKLENPSEWIFEVSLDFVRLSVHKGCNDEVERAWKQQSRVARPLSLTREFFIKSTYILAYNSVALSPGWKVFQVIDLFVITQATLYIYIYVYTYIENSGSFVQIVRQTETADRQKEK